MACGSSKIKSINETSQVPMVIMMKDTIWNDSITMKILG